MYAMVLSSLKLEGAMMLLVRYLCRCYNTKKARFVVKDRISSHYSTMGSYMLQLDFSPPNYITYFIIQLTCHGKSIVDGLLILLAYCIHLLCLSDVETHTGYLHIPFVSSSRPYVKDIFFRRIVFKLRFRRNMFCKKIFTESWLNIKVFTKLGFLLLLSM